VVEYRSKVIADLGGAEPSGNGSPLGDGKWDTVEERKEERLGSRAYLFGGLLSEGVK